jgi:hypothetical protein
MSRVWGGCTNGDCWTPDAMHRIAHAKGDAHFDFVMRMLPQSVLYMCLFAFYIVQEDAGRWPC